MNGRPLFLLRLTDPEARECSRQGNVGSAHAAGRTSRWDDTEKIPSS